MIRDPHLVHLHAGALCAEEEFNEAVRARYPVGLKLRVRIQSNHETPTPVEVIGHRRMYAGQHHRLGGIRVRILDETAFETTVGWDQVIADG